MAKEVNTGRKRNLPMRQMVYLFRETRDCPACTRKGTAFMPENGSMADGPEGSVHLVFCCSECDAHWYVLFEPKGYSDLSEGPIAGLPTGELLNKRQRWRNFKCAV